MPLARCSSGAAAASPPFRSHTLDSGWHFLDPGLALAHLHATLIEGALCRPKGIACPQGRLSLHIPTVPETEIQWHTRRFNKTTRAVSHPGNTKYNRTAGQQVNRNMRVDSTFGAPGVHSWDKQTDKQTDRQAGRQAASQTESSQTHANPIRF